MDPANAANDRRARLAAELRANLRRRKAQSKGEAGASPDPDIAVPADKPAPAGSR